MSDILPSEKIENDNNDESYFAKIFRRWGWRDMGVESCVTPGSGWEEVKEEVKACIDAGRIIENDFYTISVHLPGGEIIARFEAMDEAVYYYMERGLDRREAIAILDAESKP